MKILSRTVLLAAAVAALFCQTATVEAGWFKDLTGVSTPEPIRRIAPNGLSFRPKESGGYKLPMESKPYIDSDGNAWSGTRHSGENPANWGPAREVVINGSRYWVHGNTKRYIGPAQQYQQQNYLRQQQIAQQRQMQHQQRLQQQRQQLFQQQMMMQRQINQRQHNFMRQSLNNFNNAMMRAQRRPGYRY